ncbi:MAG: lysylphosphatidylglycerol synthase transmembrane domain-containing protein [Gaiellaceae bacterium]
MSTGAILNTQPPPAGAAGHHRLRRILLIIACAVVVGALAALFGWDLRGWFSDLWDTVSTISIEYVVAGVGAATVKTTATAYAWYWILRYAYPGEVRFRVIWAAYAVCVALNCVLPANLGTVVMFVMLTSVIASATFSGLVGAFLVQKIFFTLASVFVFAYLFITVPDTFDIAFSFLADKPWATFALLAGGAVLIVLVAISLWPRILKWWEKMKEGGRILAHPGAYFARVFLPELVAWVANLAIVAIFMAAYAIPVTFHSVISVVGSNSISNSVSVTPGGAGVNQAMNVAALSDVTDSQTATAFSVSQQLVTTAWSLLLAIVLMVWVFGWGGGRTLVAESYDEAKRKVAEQKAAKEAAKHGDAPEGTAPAPS